MVNNLLYHCCGLLPQGLKTQTGEGTFLLRFRYDEVGEPTQTFSLPVSPNLLNSDLATFVFGLMFFSLGPHQNPTEEAYKLVELRVLSNWGQQEYTCLYRFRVHGWTDVS